jgi:hypothetical protein
MAGILWLSPLFGLFLFSGGFDEVLKFVAFLWGVVDALRYEERGKPTRTVAVTGWMEAVGAVLCLALLSGAAVVGQVCGLW